MRDDDRGGLRACRHHRREGDAGHLQEIETVRGAVVANHYSGLVRGRHVPHGPVTVSTGSNKPTEIVAGATGCGCRAEGNREQVLPSIFTVSASEGSGAISPPMAPTISRLDISPIHRRYLIQPPRITNRSAQSHPALRVLYSLCSSSAIPTDESPTN